MTPERLSEMRNRLTKSTPLYGISVNECFDLLAAVETLQAENSRLRAALVPFADVFNSMNEKDISLECYFLENWYDPWTDFHNAHKTLAAIDAALEDAR